MKNKFFSLITINSRLVVMFLTLISGISNAQITFQKTFGGSGFETGHAVQQTTDGGYILFGQTTSFGNGGQDMYLVKTDNLGLTQWTQTYGGVNYEFGISAQQTTDGGYILCGGYSGLGNDSLGLIKTDLNGIVLWNKRYSGTIDREVGQFVQETSDGGFIAVGFTGNSSITNIYLLKTDNNGNELWNKVYVTTGIEYGVGVKQTSDGGYAIIGETNAKGNGGKDLYLMKTNSTGDTTWTKTYGTSLNEKGRSLSITSDGGYVLIGYEDFVGGNIFLVKTDALGNEQWHKYYGGTGWDFGHSVCQTTDGGYVLGGRKENILLNTNEMYCVKIDNLGVIQWEYTYPKGIMSDANSLQQTADGGYVLLGTTTDTIGGVNSDMFLVKISQNGILAIGEGKLNTKKISSFPNPFNQYTVISISESNQKHYRLLVTNMNGVLVKTIESIESTRIIFNRGDLLSGIYFFQLVSDYEVLGTGKLIIE